MPTVLLDNEQHQDVRVDTRAAREYGDLVNRALVLSSEFGDAAREFPVLLYKDAGADRYAAHAILGFDKDENLFIEDDRWVSRYVPASMARGPFSLGFLQRDEGEAGTVDVKVMIDDDDPRVGSDGQALFLELGGESPFLEKIKTVLRTIDAGMRSDAVFYPQLLEMGLLEQVNIRITLDDDKQYEFADYFSVDREKLAALTEDQLATLNRSGTLGLVFLLSSSVANFQHLIRRRNERGATGRH